jgi:putative addiction module component (TIGR02574 family)
MGVTDISKLSTDERLDLIGELWDSLQPDTVDLSPAQNIELARRLSTFEADKPAARSWQEVEVAVFDRQR